MNLETYKTNAPQRRFFVVLDRDGCLWCKSSYESQARAIAAERGAELTERGPFRVMRVNMDAGEGLPTPAHYSSRPGAQSCAFHQVAIGEDFSHQRALWRKISRRRAIVIWPAASYGTFGFHAAECVTVWREKV